MNGILIIDKSAGWTSMDVCAKLRGVFHERRVGHGGTLDPMATGVLPIFLGRATRAVEFATDSDKEYYAGIQLGVVTDTQDITGTVLAQRPVAIAQADLEALLPQFTGEQEQLPPMYSAVKQDGKKLYELARKGVEVERKPRTITVKALELTRVLGEHRYELRVLCTKGTYVRTLCHDIGAALGCGACLCSLRRTMAAGYTLADTVTLEQVLASEAPASLTRPVDSCFIQYSAVTVDAHILTRAKNGTPFPWSVPDGTYRVYDPDGRFLLLGECAGGIMRTRKSFFEVT